ncbi:MAG: xanthine dehydrogenase small subunit [Rhodoferax sp.]|nr:xanthine dehydrogenase small subunit [Rhodoferax sp.]
MKTKPLRFVRRGEVVSLPNVDPNRTLLEVLREDLHCTGTKEGCGEGDCGACTVVIGQANGDSLKYSAINSCIRLAHSVDGMAVWTAEDIAPTLATACAALPPEGAQSALGRPGGGLIAPARGTGVPLLHPVQQAMVDCHGSQCGFCTPGFVMSLFGLYQNKTAKGEDISREQAQAALSGNLCRCTGYRPILDAALAMQTLPPVPVNEAQVLLNLELLTHIPRGLEADSVYFSPRTLPDLLAARQRYPDAQLVAGCTDVGLWVTKMHQQFERVLDLTRVTELCRIEDYPHHIAIGAAVTLTDAFAALVADRPQLAEFAHRFAGLPVRNSGTLGGNVANGSPIGDSMPLLIALGASVVLMRWNGKQVAHREMALEDLYTGYRKNVMAPDEVLAWIKVPKATAPSAAPGRAAHAVASVGATEFSRVYKVSKRFEDDISAVCLAISIHIDNGIVRKASIGVGGVAATPVRARKTQAALKDQSWNQATIDHAMRTLRAEFAPISDMRASSAYRSTVLGNLLQRFWLETQGTALTNLRQLTPHSGTFSEGVAA